ncbi:hypothetical protein HBI25_214340 [Parastagonospora nodorum]|nr:hypothetical protein HBH52_076920 [Parastagonospora nodorum]KAH4940603.1 hypothetical protein HBH74_071050 [Parastagonospora nodorum]KAH4992049.1 hypothetical protein HBI76_047910 [Parastagonospora nodorum]KAH5141717.1 hypothetical protein HBI73_077360 [Parastagonospora nodorum]KAH5453858.1 hypothetical protein HBI47_010050 [Parastagonospora nodorum]
MRIPRLHPRPREIIKRSEQTAEITLASTAVPPGANYRSRASLPTARFFPPVSFSSTTSCLPELAIILPVPSIPTTPTNFFLPL